MSLTLKTLKPYKHKKLDFFIADDVAISTFRNDVASMEHPLFALKAGDTKTREYKNGRVTVTVRSMAGLGLATIFDKDIWIYAISKLQEAINNNQPISRTIVFTPYEFFITTNRNKSGRAYEDLEKALDRLKGTMIKTNIFYSEKEQETTGFGLIDSWKIIEKQKGLVDIGIVEITLPDWLYQAITKTKILKITSDYFRIRKAIDRRLYEIARKHCGSQDEFVISLHKLYLKTGSTSNIAKFKFNIKQLAKVNDLPDYKVDYDNKTDNIIFTNCNKNTFQTKLFCKQKKNKQENHKKKMLIKKINNNIKLDLKIPEGFRK